MRSLGNGLRIALRWTSAKSLRAWALELAKVQTRNETQISPIGLQRSIHELMPTCVPMLLSASRVNYSHTKDSFFGPAVYRINVYFSLRRIQPFVLDDAANVSGLRITAVRTQIAATEHWHFLRECMPLAIRIDQHAGDPAWEVVVNVAFYLYG